MTGQELGVENREVSGSRRRTRTCPSVGWSTGAAQPQGVGDHDDAGGGHDGRVDTVAARTYREEGKAISVAETMNDFFLFG